MTNVYPVALV